tara:strand:+ start:1817 stop:2341 length:525 start_codon:yes stop_codon:yes gene_type:complete
MKLDYFTKDIGMVPEIIIGTIVVYIAVIILTRIFGLKSFSKMTGFDFVNTVAIGNLIGMTIATNNPKLLLGILLIGLLYLANYLVSLLRFRSKTARKHLDNSPVLIMRDGQILYDNLNKVEITENELRGKLREANVIRLDEVKAVILETTGDVSVLHGDDDKEIEDYILEDVEK